MSSDGRCGARRSSLRAVPHAAALDRRQRRIGFAAVVEEAPVPVLVDLWAPWCGPCRLVSPALERLARQYAGRLKLVKVNVDESPRLQARFGVRSIPTLILMHRGDAVARQVGAAPEPALRTWLDQGLARVPSPHN